MAEFQPLTYSDGVSEHDTTYEVVEHLVSPSAHARLCTWSITGEEFELSKATRAQPKKRYNQDALAWVIPDSDSESDMILEKPDLPNYTWTSRVAPGSNSNGLQVQLPSESEEENIYDLVKSPTCSIQSAEPPLPPPLSSIPSRAHALPKLGETVEETKRLPEPGALSHSISISAPDNIGLVKEIGCNFTKQYETIGRNGSFSSGSGLSEIDPYDDIDVESAGTQRTVGLSKPRYKIALQKGKSKSLDEKYDISEQRFDIYAKIPKKSKWNFPSSDEDEEGPSSKLGMPQLKLKKFGELLMPRQDSVTSEEGERPLIPPKLWEEELLQCSNGDNCKESEENQSLEGSVTLREKNYDRDSIIMEYNSLYCTNDSQQGSLAGADEDDYDMPDSIGSVHSFKPNNDTDGDKSSILSQDSYKSGAKYERTSACVDMDQLSLDSSGKLPKRIVETHETHEIIPSENNEDDIVERIIETQTITEKLDDNLPPKDYNGEDYSKYLEDDDEFVSHIYTLGRTLEKGNVNKRKSKSIDFAFVENPFLPPSPVIETMPIEKKTVKQKITTLVKKKKVKEEDNIYAEVVPNISIHDDVDHTDDEYENEQPGFPVDNNSHMTTNKEQNTTASIESHSSEHKTAESLLYEAIDEPKAATKSKDRKKKKKIKSEKTRSLFSGIRKLLRRHKSHSQDSTDTSNSAVVIVEDDYQEFVP